MDGVGGDNIELLRGRKDVVPGIVINNLRALVVQHIVILFAKKLTGSSRNQAFQFTDDEALHLGIWHGGSGGNSSAGSNDQHRARRGMNQRWKVPHHALQAHIDRGGGSLRLPAHVEESLVSSLGDYD